MLVDAFALASLLFLQPEPSAWTAPTVLQSAATIGRQAVNTPGSEASLLPARGAGPRTELKLQMIRGVIPAPVVQAATALLDLPMGAEREIVIEGRSYVFRLEQHYHPPGFVGGPTGWHKGVTVYEWR